MSYLFDITFLTFRLAVKAFVDQLEFWMSLIITRFQIENDLQNTFANYLALIKVSKNLFLSDLKIFTPKTFEDKNVSGYEGKVAVLTGGDKDVGAETAIYLANHGFRVIIGITDLEKSKHIIDCLKTENKPYVIKALYLDLTYLKSVRRFAKEVSELEPKIDLLINGAECLVGRRTITEEGFEKHFVANYLGHFLLTLLLTENLYKSENGRVVNVTDMLYHTRNINFKDLNFTKNYNLFTAFAQSKTAVVLISRELAHKFKDTNITVYVLSLPILRQWKPFDRNDWRYLFNGWFAKLSNPVTGAQTILYCALEEKLRNESGFYYNNCERIEYLSNQTDLESAKLWSGSLAMVGFEECHLLSFNNR